MDTRFKPKPGEFGSHPVFLTVAVPTTLTANATTEIFIPTPYRRAWVRGAAFQCTTAPADADGTILATLKKRVASDDSEVSITSALDLEAATVEEANPFTIPSSTAERYRILAPGDVLKVDVVNNSAAIDTQTAGGFIVVELLLLQ